MIRGNFISVKLYIFAFLDKFFETDLLVQYINNPKKEII
jgi:hypothetical protein